MYRKGKRSFWNIVLVVILCIPMLLGGLIVRWVVPNKYQAFSDAAYLVGADLVDAFQANESGFYYINGRYSGDIEVSGFTAKGRKSEVVFLPKTLNRKTVTALGASAKTGYQRLVTGGFWGKTKVKSIYLSDYCNTINFDGIDLSSVQKIVTNNSLTLNNPLKYNGLIITKSEIDRRNLNEQEQEWLATHVKKPNVDFYLNVNLELQWIIDEICEAILNPTLAGVQKAFEDVKNEPYFIDYLDEINEILKNPLSFDEFDIALAYDVLLSLSQEDRAEFAKLAKNLFDSIVSSDTKDIITYVHPLFDYEEVGTPLQTVPAPTRVGYSFDGWYLLEAGGTILYNGAPVTNDGLKLYAKWTKL